MSQLQIFLVLILLSLPAHAEATKARIIYDPATLKINRVIHVDDDRDLAPHQAYGEEKIYDLPEADYRAMLIHCQCAENNWINLHLFEQYLRDHMTVG